MSASSVIFVLERFMRSIDAGGTPSLGLLGALGPGFASELVLMKWG
jgi:predicted naringenin-chalcone synthase